MGREKMYIILGIGIIAVVIVLFSIAKFAAFSEFMSGFKKGTFEKLMIGLSVAGVVSLAYGIYYEVTYQPPYLDIQVNGNEHTVFGEIGDVGYYGDGLVTKDKEANLHLVTWEDWNLEGNTVVELTYPSGATETWEANITELNDQVINGLAEAHDVQSIYELSPYTFTESGNVEVRIQEAEASFIIEVKE